jgi:hypothetical protein
VTRLGQSSDLDAVCPPSDEAYWAGGHTLGFIQCAAFLAGRAVAEA